LNMHVIKTTLTLLGFTIVATVIFHFDFAGFPNRVAVLLNIAIVGGMLLLIVWRRNQVAPPT